MFSKEELKELKTNFWNDFRIHMRQHKSVNGRKMNWLNYPSDISFVHIRLDADSNHAQFIIDIQAKDAGVREIIWEQLHELKIVLESYLGTEGNWQKDCSSPIIPAFDRISYELPGVSMFNKNDTAKIYAFFENRLIQFDAFYQEFKDILVHLAS